METTHNFNINLTEVKNVSQNLRIAKNDKIFEDSDRIKNFRLQQKSKTKTDEYRKDIFELTTISMPSPRIIFISAFLCAPFILFMVMIICYYWP